MKLQKRNGKVSPKFTEPMGNPESFSCIICMVWQFYNADRLSSGSRMTHCRRDWANDSWRVLMMPFVYKQRKNPLYSALILWIRHSLPNALSIKPLCRNYQYAPIPFIDNKYTSLGLNVWIVRAGLQDRKWLTSLWYDPRHWWHNYSKLRWTDSYTQSAFLNGPVQTHTGYGLT